MIRLRSTCHPGSFPLFSLIGWVLTALTMAVPDVSAQQSIPVDPRDPASLVGSWSASIENDTFLPGFLSPTDQQYTNGLHALYSVDGDRSWSAPLRALCRPILCGDRYRAEYLRSLRIAQTGHTPDSLERFDFTPGSRPFSGLLFGELELSFADSLWGRPRLTTMGVLTGLWGRASFAETAQAGFHTIQEHRDPKGWETNDALDFALQAAYRTRVSFMTKESWQSLQAAFEPEVEATIGDPRTDLGFSVTIRAGRTLRTFAPAGQPHTVALAVNPEVAEARAKAGGRTPREDPTWRFEIFGQARGRVIGDNGFIPNNTPGGSPIRRLVGDLNVGARVELWPWAGTYIVTHRSAELADERYDNAHDYGILMLTRYLGTTPDPNYLSEGVTGLFRLLEISAGLGVAEVKLPNVADPGGDRHSMRIAVDLRVTDWLTLVGFGWTGGGLFAPKPRIDGAYTDHFLRVSARPLRGLRLRVPTLSGSKWLDALQLSAGLVDGRWTEGDCRPSDPGREKICGKQLRRDFGEAIQWGVFYGYELWEDLRVGPEFTYVSFDDGADLSSLVLRISWAHGTPYLGGR